MADARIEKLIERLIAKTDARDLKWEETAITGQFQVTLGDHTITILNGRNRRGENLVIVRIADRFANVIEEINDEAFEDNPHAYEEMYRMWEAARRQALGVDEALKKILDDLN